MEYIYFLSGDIDLLHARAPLLKQFLKHEDLQHILTEMKSGVPDHCLLLWGTTKANGGFVRLEVRHTSLLIQDASSLPPQVFAELVRHGSCQGLQTIGCSQFWPELLDYGFALQKDETWQLNIHMHTTEMHDLKYFKRELLASQNRDCTCDCECCQASALIRDWDNKERRTFCTFVGDRLAGFCSVVTTPQKVQIHNFYVFKSLRRAGIGSAMLHFLRHEFKRFGEKVLEVCCGCCTPFFEKKGFSLVKDKLVRPLSLNKQELTFTPLLPGDKEALALGKLSSDALEDAGVTDLDARGIANFVRFESKAGRNTTVAKYKESVVGYALYYVRSGQEARETTDYHTVADEEHVYLAELFVATRYQGFTIGETLLKKAIALAKARKVPLYLHVEMDNYCAQKFYLGHQFVFTDAAHTNRHFEMMLPL